MSLKVILLAAAHGLPVLIAAGVATQKRMAIVVSSVAMGFIAIGFGRSQYSVLDIGGVVLGGWLAWSIYGAKPKESSPIRSNVPPPQQPKISDAKQEVDDSDHRVQIAMTHYEGTLMLEGKQDRPKDIQKGLQKIEQAANGGYLIAQLYLGDIYLWWDEIEADLARACHFYEMARSQVKLDMDCGNVFASASAASMLKYRNAKTRDDFLAILLEESRPRPDGTEGDTFIARYLMDKMSGSADPEFRKTAAKIAYKYAENFCSTTIEAIGMIYLHSPDKACQTLGVIMLMWGAKYSFISPATEKLLKRRISSLSENERNNLQALWSRLDEDDFIETLVAKTPRPSLPAPIVTSTWYSGPFIGRL